MNPPRVVTAREVGQPPTTTSTKKRLSQKKRQGGGRGSSTVPKVPHEPSERKRKWVAGKSETACEVKLESQVKEKPDVIDKLADEYLANLRAEASLVQFPEEGQAWDAARPAALHQNRLSNAGGAGGRRGGPRRSGRTAMVEEYVVTRKAGRLPVDLPPGTLVRKPAEKLVQLIAQAIHDSPCQVLRVRHVYSALQMRYPYFMYLEKSALSSWKSSVRHALFQKGFTKLCPPTTGFQSGREKCCFWGLNYNKRLLRPETATSSSSQPYVNERTQLIATSTLDTILPDLQSWKAGDVFVVPLVMSPQDCLPFAEPGDTYKHITDIYADSVWDNVGANEEVG